MVDQGGHINIADAIAISQAKGAIQVIHDAFDAAPVWGLSPVFTSVIFHVPARRE
jgi:hypothetical protein